jgi:hypothetical protein
LNHIPKVEIDDMIDGKFDVIFRGQVVRNMEINEVKSNLVALFKSSPEAVEKLFGGSEVAVRKGLDYSTAMKYQGALKKAGALALIKEVEQKPVVSTQGKATFGAPSEPNEVDDAGASTTTSSQSSQTSFVGETPSAMDNGKTSTSESSSANQHGAMSSTGEGVNDMSLAEVGARILPDKVYEKREVDTSELSLASAGERILPEKPPEEHPQPSIEHLKLEK